MYDVDGIPHVAFQGQERIIGGGTTMYPYYEPVYQDFVDDESPMTIDLSMMEGLDGVEMTAVVELEEDLSTDDNKIIFILTYNFNTSYFATVVRYDDDEFDLAAGEINTYFHTFDIDDDWEIDNVTGVVIVQTFTSTGEDYDGPYGPYAMYPIYQAALANVESDIWLPGDPNNDGSVNVQDVLLTVNHIVGVALLTGPSFYAADANDDNVVNVMDVVVIVNIILDGKLSRDSGKAIIWKNKLDLSGNIGGLQGKGDLISALKGQDQIISANGYFVIFNTCGYIETTHFEFASAPKNLIIADANAEEIEIIAVSDFELLNNYPNPFNPTTTIPFQLPTNCNVVLKIYDVNGHLVETLIDSELKAGNHFTDWHGMGFTSGVYFYSIQADDFSRTKKMVLMK